jgi:hypothetical protein
VFQRAPESYETMDLYGIAMSPEAVKSGFPLAVSALKAFTPAVPVVETMKTKLELSAEVSTTHGFTSDS